MGQNDYFWINALGALAAMAIGEKDHPLTAASAGMAESAVDRSDPHQLAAVDTINSQYFGSS